VLFMGGGGTDLLSPAWGVRPVAGERFQVPEYETSASGLPRGVRQKEFDYSLYEFVPPAAAPPSTLEIDVGTEDDLHVLRFHAKETTKGRSFRWSRDASYISIARLPPASRTVTLWMDDGGRPDAVAPARVTVSLLIGYGGGKPASVDRVLGTVTVGNDGFQPYTVQIPPDLASTVAARGEPVRLKIATTVWVPRRVLGTPDDRDLGVMVDRVAVQ
jgi:hypothetical protein